MTRAYHRDRLTWLAFLMMAFFSYFINVLGPITPFLKNELSLSYAVSSLHFSAFAVGILVIGLAGHGPIRWLGRRRSLWIGAAGMSVGALLLVAGRTPVITIGASFIMGLCGSLILAIVPSVLSDQHGERRAAVISEANVIASLVATTAPLLVGWFALFPGLGGWRLGLGLMAFAPLLLFLIFMTVTVPESASDTTEQAVSRERLPLLFWLYWVALILGVSVEFCMICWSADYLETAHALRKASAAQAVSLFFAGMIAGRLASSRLVRSFATPQVVTISILTGSIGFLLFWLAGKTPLVLSGLFITGLGVAGLYPLLLSLCIGSAGQNTLLASARSSLASGIAIIALPLALGRLADAVGIQRAYGLVLFLLAAVFLIIRLAGRQPAGQSNSQV